MKLIRIDIVSLLDLRFIRPRQLSRLRCVSSGSGNSSLFLDRLKESFSWLFYGEQLRDFDLCDISPLVRNAKGAALRINCRLGIGTYIAWRTFQRDSDVHTLKSSVGREIENDLAPVFPFFEDLRIERYYPFISLEADTDDIDEFAGDNAIEIGRILTGDLEGERPATLSKYVEKDLSLRSYEKLLLRWTDALALYSRMKSEKLYEECMFRAVQVFEHCILGRVSLLAAGEQMGEFLSRLAIVTPGKWFRARDLLTTFSSIEETFVMYPRVQSVEADRLIRAAHDQFGLDRVLAGAKAKQMELREQLEWAKALTLGFLVFITYFLDKIIGWEKVTSHVLKWITHVFH